MQRMTRDEILAAYALLDVRVGAAPQEIRRARLRLIRQHHPDLWMHNPIRRLAGEEHVKAINRAFSLVEEFLERGIAVEDLPEAPRPRKKRRTWRRIFKALPRMPWWRSKRFSFEDPEFFGPGWWHYAKMFSVGTLAWLTLILAASTLGDRVLGVEFLLLVVVGLYRLARAAQRAWPRGGEADWEGAWDDVDEDSL